MKDIMALCDTVRKTLFLFTVNFCVLCDLSRLNIRS